MTLTYPFTQAESDAAYEEWGANCGPTALAFALQVPLSAVRGKIPDFERKGYTSPSMMTAGVEACGRTFTRVFSSEWSGTPRGIEQMFHPQPALVRVQFGGPWSREGANPRWAYNYTHWVCSWIDTVGPVYST